jgi:hypothetical protein
MHFDLSLQVEQHIWNQNGEVTNHLPFAAQKQRKELLLRGVSILNRVESGGIKGTLSVLPALPRNWTKIFKP